MSEEEYDAFPTEEGSDAKLSDDVRSRIAKQMAENEVPETTTDPATDQ